MKKQKKKKPLTPLQQFAYTRNRIYGQLHMVQGILNSMKPITINEAVLADHMLNSVNILINDFKESTESLKKLL